MAVALTDIATEPEKSELRFQGHLGHAAPLGFTLGYGDAEGIAAANNFAVGARVTSTVPAGLPDDIVEAFREGAPSLTGGNIGTVHYVTNFPDPMPGAFNLSGVLSGVGSKEADCPAPEEPIPPRYFLFASVLDMPPDDSLGQREAQVLQTFRLAADKLKEHGYKVTGPYRGSSPAAELNCTLFVEQPAAQL